MLVGFGEIFNSEQGCIEDIDDKVAQMEKKIKLVLFHFSWKKTENQPRQRTEGGFTVTFVNINIYGVPTMCIELLEDEQGITLVLKDTVMSI